MRKPHPPKAAHPISAHLLHRKCSLELKSHSSFECLPPTHPGSAHRVPPDPPLIRTQLLILNLSHSLNNKPTVIEDIRLLKVGSEAAPRLFLESGMHTVTLGIWGEGRRLQSSSAGSRCGAQTCFAFAGGGVSADEEHSLLLND